MVIQNSEVSMTSKGSYQSATKIDYQISQKPAITLGDITIVKDGEGDFMSSLNYALGKDGEVKEVGDTQTGESPSANRQVRFDTLSYLLRILLMRRIYGEKCTFGDMLAEMFAENSGYEVTTEVNYEYSESQEVSFSSKGTAVTADGRTLEFNYGFTLSESFQEKFTKIESEFIKYIDPLVINLDDCPTKIADQTFYFDLDADGDEDEIHRLQAGSGFLALDKNGDGKIGSGSELFGATTGDGFAELALFDEDGNGWIDENDEVFDRLRVWTENEEGEMELYTLKESDVGAIYLGRVRTDYVNHDDEHRARAAMRQSGIFLHESDGHAGGIQHVDFAT